MEPSSGNEEEIVEQRNVSQLSIVSEVSQLPKEVNIEECDGTINLVDEK
jgi:hypothetical protein